MISQVCICMYKKVSVTETNIEKDYIHLHWYLRFIFANLHDIQNNSHD